MEQYYSPAMEKIKKQKAKKIQQAIREANKKKPNHKKLARQIHIIDFTYNSQVVSQVFEQTTNPGILQDIAKCTEYHMDFRGMAMDQLLKIGMMVDPSVQAEIDHHRQKQKENRQKQKEAQEARERERAECASGNHLWIAQKVRWGPGYMNGYRCGRCGKTKVPDIRV